MQIGRWTIALGPLLNWSASFRVLRPESEVLQAFQSSFRSLKALVEAMAAVKEITKSINEVCRSKGGHYAGYSCQVRDVDDLRTQAKSGNQILIEHHKTQSTPFGTH